MRIKYCMDVYKYLFKIGRLVRPKTPKIFPCYSKNILIYDRKNRYKM